MRLLIDTNVLLRICEPAHEWHKVASTALQTVRDAGHEPVIVPQNIYEFWVVATRTVDANGWGKTPAEAAKLAADLRQLFTILRDERTVLEFWLELVESNHVAGVKAYDAKLVAAMQRHRVTHIVTFNDADFRRFAHVRVWTPGGIVTGIDALPA
jgi:predicted nucleic acid-binding protein